MVGRVIFLALMALTNTASACSIAVSQIEWVDPPIEVATDGSFYLRSQYSRFEGDPVLDLGNGLVAQRQMRRHICGYGAESVIVVACDTGFSVEFTAPPALHPRVETLSLRDRRRSLPWLRPGIPSFWAIGEFPIENARSWYDVFLLANLAGLEKDFDPFRRLWNSEPERQFDPNWGCSEYYPDSVGVAL